MNLPRTTLLTTLARRSRFEMSSARQGRQGLGPSAPTPRAVNVRSSAMATCACALWYHEVSMRSGTLYLKRQSSHPSGPVVQANYSATGTSGGLVTGLGAKRRAIIER